MKSFNVEYQKVGDPSVIVIEHVIEDGILESAANYRWFGTEDGSRFEIPMDGVAFRFGPERLEIVKENRRLEAEAKAKAEAESKESPQP